MNLLNVLRLASAISRKRNEGKLKAMHGTSTKLVLFGGKNNEQYLGCISCPKYETDSIMNKYQICW